MLIPMRPCGANRPLGHAEWVPCRLPQWTRAERALLLRLDALTDEGQCGKNGKRSCESLFADNSRSGGIMSGIPIYHQCLNLTSSIGASARAESNNPDAVGLQGSRGEGDASGPI